LANSVHDEDAKHEDLQSKNCKIVPLHAMNAYAFGVEMQLHTFFAKKKKKKSWMA
jgi:hypothetical protein